MTLKQLQAELTLKLDEIAVTCEQYGYDALPTLVLRHPKGSSSSLLISNDDLGSVMLCVAELADIGNESKLGVFDALLMAMSDPIKPLANNGDSK